MPAVSAGLLLFRRGSTALEVLLVHMGGPFWARKDAGAWTIPKGEVNPGEELLDTARREFLEETGFAPAGVLVPLGHIKQAAGKVVHAWAVEGDFDVTLLASNTFSMEWPKGSGKIREFPEVDRAEWFTLQEARARILKGQLPLLDALESIL
jgi:predicted NUDIX family NTP pyrophosphohydrolase